MDTSKKFIYINNDSLDSDNSVNVPVSTLCGMETTGSNSIRLYFKEAVESDTLDVILLRTDDSDPGPIMESIVHEINHGKNSRIVLGDDFSKKYLHPDITNVSSIAEASAESIVYGDITLGDSSIYDKVEINGKLIQGNVTVTDVDTQNHTLTAAEFRGGIVVHTSNTGAGTITFDNATNLRSILELSSDDEVAKCLYVNDGDQDVTLNGGTPEGVVYKTNPTIPPGGTATLMVRRESSGTMEVYILAHATRAQSPSVSVTATIDGAGTGTIADGTSYATVTSENADYIVVLPTPTPGNIVYIFVGANGYELRSSDPATVAINGGAGTDFESAIGANVLVRCVCTSATSWVATQFAADGTESAVQPAAV